MAIQPPHQTPLPPFAKLLKKQNVTELQVRAIFGNWFKICLCAAIPFFLVTLVIFAALIQFHVIADPLQRLGLLAGNLICASILLGLFLLGMAALVVSIAKAQITINATSVRLKDFGTAYEIPIDQIRGIRQIKYPRRRLEFDPAGRPGRLFFRGVGTTLEITTPHGRIEFFSNWSTPEVTWLTTALHRLLFPNIQAPPLTDKEISHTEPVIRSTRIYGGNDRLFLLWTPFGIGLVACIISGWFAYQGLSSVHWPSAQGQVIHSDFEEKRNSTRAQIEYAYTVAGKQYQNDDIGFGRSPSDSVVKNLILQHPDGAPISVFYNPSRPQASIVIPGLAHFTGYSAAQVSSFSYSPSRLYSTDPRPLKSRFRGAYKVSPTSTIEPSEAPQPILEWRTPEDAWRNIIRSHRRAALASFARIFAVTALSLWAAQHWLRPYCPPDLSWTMVNLIVLGYAIVWPLALFAGQFRRTHKPTDFAITEECLIASNGQKSIPWKDIASFTVRSDPHLRDRRILTLHLKSLSSWNLHLPPETELAILAEFSRRLLQAPPPRRKFRVS